MQTNLSAAWAIEHPAIAAARLRTSARHLATALREVSALVGYLDGKIPSEDYVGLGMTRVESELLKAIRAMDLADFAEAHPVSPVATRQR